MKRKLLIVLMVFCSLVCAGLMWTVARSYVRQYLREDATIGMINAVWAAFAAEVEKESSPVQKVVGEARNGLVLNTLKYDAVISELAKKYNLDPPAKWNRTKPLFDPWGNRLEIWCRKLPDGRYMSRVTSKGRDGALGTADDVAVGDEIDSLE